MRTETSALGQRCVYLLALLGALSRPVLAQSRYSQIVLTFPEERSFTYHYEPKDRALVLEFKGTSSQELESLFHYDERIVQRALFKDMGGQAVEARLILRDENVKVLVNTFQEPFRVSIDFFDPDYKETIDPNTGLPLSGSPSETELTSEGGDNYPNPVFASGNKAPAPYGPQPAPTGYRENNAGKKRLLQVQPENIRTSQELVMKLNEVNGGIGSAWKTYPPYIARIQTANLKNTKNSDDWARKNAEKAMSSGEALAQYAGQLFDFGHESRALTLYQKLLHEDPSIFEKQAETIWKLGEIHLGQANLTLADGYYESLIEKHRDHPLAAYAMLRRLDIKAIRALKEAKTEYFPGLQQEASKIPTKLSPGLSAQIALRGAYWGLEANKLKSIISDFDALPEPSKQALIQLENTRSQAEGPKTAFLMDSIILHNKMLAEIWNYELSKQTAEYLNRYKGSATEPFRTNILKNAEKNFITKMDALAEQKDYASIIQLVEALPANLDELRKTPTVSWATAESLKELKQYSRALPYYENSASRAQSKIDQFRSQFILTQVSTLALNSEQAKGNNEKISQLQNKLKQVDNKSWETWQTLTPQEKSLAYAENKESIEQQINQSTLTKTSPLILLEMFSQKLSSESPSSGSAVNAKDNSSVGTERMIPLLVGLSKHFEKMGLSTERRKTKKLISYLDTKNSKLDKETMKIWTDELTQLAEELRQENNFLEAGRLYTQAGSSNNQWEGRAEALYKGGLLLYRAGRRDEAKSAFQQAASDGSNLLYADLAKERLEQLK